MVFNSCCISKLNIAKYKNRRDCNELLQGSSYEKFKIKTHRVIFDVQQLWLNSVAFYITVPIS